MCTARTFFCLSVSVSLTLSLRGGVSFIAVEICRFSVSRGPMPPAAVTTIVSLPISSNHSHTRITDSDTQTATT